MIGYDKLSTTERVLVINDGLINLILLKIQSSPLRKLWGITHILILCNHTSITLTCHALVSMFTHSLSSPRNINPLELATFPESTQLCSSCSLHRRPLVGVKLGYMQSTTTFFASCLEWVDLGMPTKRWIIIYITM